METQLLQKSHIKTYMSGHRYHQQTGFHLIHFLKLFHLLSEGVVSPSACWTTHGTLVTTNSATHCHRQNCYWRTLLHYCRLRRHLRRCLYWMRRRCLDGNRRSNEWGMERRYRVKPIRKKIYRELYIAFKLVKRAFNRRNTRVAFY